MDNVNLRELKEIVKAATELKRPVIALSSPGIGKSSVMVQAAKEMGISYIVISASGLDPTDTCGIPYVHDGQSKYGIPSMLPDTKRDGKKGLLIIDEIPSCPLAVQVSLYSLFLDRKLGEFDLPDGWVPMATGNFAKDGAVAFNLSTALMDRAFVVEVKADFQIWKEDFAIPRKIDQRLLSFLNFKESNFYTFEKRERNQSKKTFATSRSWEMASDVLKIKSLKGNSLYAMLASCLGPGITTELMGFFNTWENLPNINDIFEGKLKTAPKDKPDVLYALIGAITVGLSRFPKDASLVKAVDNVLDYSLILPTEFGLLLIHDMKATDPIYYRDLILKSKNFKIWVDKFGKIIQ